MGSPPTELPVTVTASVTVPDGPNDTFPDATEAVDEGEAAVASAADTNPAAATTAETTRIRSAPTALKHTA
ncbi:MAG: hypothetical protein WCB67_09555 [Solirubrobacteraceae bacterium]